MILSSWNIRGLNSPLKQNEILKHVKKNKIVVMGILETKLAHHSLRGFINRKFKRWKVAENFQHNPNGRILIIWQADKVDLDVLESNAQAIHCVASCKSTSTYKVKSHIYLFLFYLSFFFLVCNSLKSQIQNYVQSCLWP